MDEATKKAFDFASDVTKQLITVASAIVTVTVTFSKDTPPPARVWAYAAWALFLVSILLGFAALMSMTGELQPKVNRGAGKDNPSVWQSNIRRFSIAQIFVFLAAISLTAWFGRIAMRSGDEAPSASTVCRCILETRQPSPPTLRPDHDGIKKKDLAEH